MSKAEGFRDHIKIRIPMKQAGISMGGSGDDEVGCRDHSSLPVQFESPATGPLDDGSIYGYLRKRQERFL